MNEIKINNNNSEDNYELYRNLFSNQIFKPTDESYDKNGLLNEKQIKFQSDKNGFLFSDGKTDLEKNYLSDDEYSFGEAVDFIKQLENDSWKINLKINFDKAWSDIKSFFGFENENQNDEQKRLEDVFGNIANDLQKNGMSTKFDELKVKAKKLDDALNKKIESNDRENLIKISLEIKKCYFEFESSVKETLNVTKKIICQENHLSDERLRIIKEKYCYCYGTKNYMIIENAFAMVKKIGGRYFYEYRGDNQYFDWFEELLDLLVYGDIKEFSRLKDLIGEIKKIVLRAGTELYNNFNSYIYCANKISGIRNSLSSKQNLSKEDLTKITDSVEILARKLEVLDKYKQSLDKIRGLLSKENIHEPKNEQIFTELENVLKECKKNNKQRTCDFVEFQLGEEKLANYADKTSEILRFLSKEYNEYGKSNCISFDREMRENSLISIAREKNLTANDWIRACDILYEMLTDLESLTDNENLFYEMIDDSIVDLETSLNKYDTNLIKKAEKYKNSLDQIPNKKINEYKNICNKCENLTHQLSNLKSQKLENNSKYNQLNNKYQNETKLLSDIKDIYQAYKYALSVVFSNEINQANTNISKFKTNHSCFLWLISHSRLFLIGYLFRFIAWVILKGSGNLEADYNNYQASFDKVKSLQYEKKISNQNRPISKNEFNNLCKKIFNAKNENEIDTSNKNFVLNENTDYKILSECLLKEINNKFNQNNLKFTVDENSIENVINDFSNTVKKDEQDLSSLVVDIGPSNINKQIRDTEIEINSLNTKKENIEKEIKEKIKFVQPNEVGQLIDINRKRLQLKQLQAPYKIINALENQAKILEANRTIISTLTSKLLDVPAEKIKDKSVDTLLKIQDKKSSETAIIETSYFSKDKLNKIKEEQSGSNERGVFNTIFKHRDKILKPGKMHMICKSEEDKYNEISRLNCFKKNSFVLVDTAVKGNLAYEVAKLFDFDCIVSTQIGISDDNHISVMEDALKDGRIFHGKSKPDAINQINKSMQNPDNAYKLFCSASELNFLDVLLLQTDRHDENFSYNDVGVRGIDNEFIMPTRSGPLMKKLNNSVPGQDSILYLAMIKIPVIPKELSEKIMSVKNEDLRIVLNPFFIDDYQGCEKVDFAIERFIEIKKFIEDGNIQVVDKFDSKVMTRITEQKKLGSLLKGGETLLQYTYHNFIPTIMKDCEEKQR